MIEKIKYREYEIYYSDTDSIAGNLAKKIVEKNYEVLEKYKDTERNYVAKISIDGTYYVLKSPKAETVIPQRRIQTPFKKGEALTSLTNLEEYKDKGYKEFIIPRAVILKKRFFIEESFILMDYIEGEKLRTVKDIDEVIEIIKKIHAEGIYHGDLNTSNFIKTSEGIKIIDTQGKREKLWNFKRSYDILTLKRDLLVKEHNYDVEKKYTVNKFSIGYMLAFFIKEFKYTPAVEKIRNLKKILRQKGWKI